MAKRIITDEEIKEVLVFLDKVDDKIQNINSTALKFRRFLGNSQGITAEEFYASLNRFIASVKRDTKNINGFLDSAETEIHK